MKYMCLCIVTHPRCTLLFCHCSKETRTSLFTNKTNKMVYISDDGKVLNSTPWGLKQLFGFFTGIIYAVLFFFQTLFSPGTSGEGNQHYKNFRPGSGPPKPPSKRWGGLNKPSVDVPFMGGCSSCAR
ncbi:selenoprotein K-like [Prorops nasuta]|uniref:selenoprotein K-like n=1 Tax=Prorops nasuta TaxID=863751 RepID=UPI0034CE764E